MIAAVFLLGVHLLRGLRDSEEAREAGAVGDLGRADLGDVPLVARSFGHPLGVVGEGVVVEGRHAGFGDRWILSAPRGRVAHEEGGGIAAKDTLDRVDDLVGGEVLDVAVVDGELPAVEPTHGIDLRDAHLDTELHLGAVPGIRAGQRVGGAEFDVATCGGRPPASATAVVRGEAVADETADRQAGNAGASRREKLTTRHSLLCFLVHSSNPPVGRRSETTRQAVAEMKSAESP